ncbi:GNAT superfamily N-acetyltransferase [Cryobacterium mesophilum]|nr:GNAT family N-acetyltransferase [Terrimesophilobacter mesophilus]MBB5632514.1 GNAT superfamily N-acetyltransferase [Terrimesophilobacter mesophilus]
MTTFTIDELVIPASIDAPDAADFIDMTHVRNEIEADTVGNRDLAYEPAELLPNWQDPYEPKTCLVARVDGRIVARAIYEAPIEEGARDAWLSIEVLPAFRRRGIGAALYERLAARCVTEGRTLQQGYFIHKRSDDSEQLPSPTGFGSIPLDNPETRFLLARGFTLEQVERMSRLALPVDETEFARLFDSALAAAGDEYRLVRWTGRTPEQWVSDIALLHRRMSTDAPAAGLEVAEANWDEERVRTMDDRWDGNPRAALTVAAEHAASGHLAGFTELSVPPELERPVEQLDTLVLKEHRGHRLGMLLKLANLQYLAETHPGHPSVTTFNAEENRPMLDVNEAIGFVPVGYGGGWKKEADRSPSR